MRRLFVVLGCLGLASLSACTSPEPGDGDAGDPGRDASAFDARVEIDAGTPVDAAPPEDSGPKPVDSGSPIDAGPGGKDSGMPPDAAVSDAGSDAAAIADTGVDAPIETCPEMDLGSALGVALVMGSTVGYSDDGDRSCGSSGAPDRAFTWTAPAAGTYVIDMNGSAFDTLIDVLAGTCSGTVLGCDDDGGEGVSSLVTVTLAAGEVIVVVVDGYSSASGDFVLSIHASVPEDCTNGLDDDRDGDADCLDFDCDALPACHETVCDDGLDDDGDFDVDCFDFDCDADPACTETGPVECFDGIDNDGDFAIDCDDFDCRTEADCIESGPLECHDTIDNDGDLDVDCFDFDCDAECREPGRCGDGLDNDEDGLTDCIDDECSCDPLCTGATVVCPDVTLGSVVGDAVAMGVLPPATCGERRDGSCGSGGAGGEIELLWTAPSAGTYVFTTYDTTAAGGTYDTMLYVLDGACTAPELVCNDDDVGLLSRVVVTATAGQAFVIVLDAYGETDSGNYTLNITMM